MSDNSTLSVSVPAGPSRLSSMQVFALLTVSVTTAGAAVAVWQLISGEVGALEWGLLALFYFASAIGIEGGFHRYFSHSAFRGTPFTVWMMGILGSMAAQGPVLFWAATHRKHHAYTDKDGDPHSPNIQGTGTASRLRGLFHAHIGWLFAREQASWAKFAPDLIRRHEIIRINQTYLLWVAIGLALPAVIGGLVAQSWQGAFNGFIWGGLLRIFLLDHVTWAVNSVCHTIGSQPHKTDNNSRNLFILCIPSVGGSFHNNHHAYPVGARNDHQSRWQIDLSGLFIELLGTLGLADNIRRYRQGNESTPIRKGESHEQ